MGKSTYHIKETKNSYSFSYSGDLKEALEKARKDLQKEKENTDIAHWEWIRKKAVSAILAHEKKITKIKAFIKCAERNLKESEADNEATQTGKPDA
ncbi:MAG: hypothetical protein Q4C65_03040 [Eubacteriales bacterium]|nr:hypothetical protein [Eubacteriales bacterium]